MSGLILAKSRLRWRAAIAAAAVVGLLLGLLGPFGSYLNDGALLRVGYWIGAMLTGLVVYGAGVLVSLKLAPPGSRGAWPALVASVLIASLPEAALTRLAAFRLWPELAGHVGGWTLWYEQTLIIGLTTVLAATLVIRAATPPPGLPPSSAPVIVPPAVSAVRLGGDVIALQMEDHYVRVHTGTGSKLLMMPLARAIAAMQVDGLQTHRSWWVARHAVAGVEGTPRSMSLRLTNGIVAPVSRSSVTSLRAAGWFQPDVRATDA